MTFWQITETSIMFWTIKDIAWNMIVFDVRLYLFLITGSVEFNSAVSAMMRVACQLWPLYVRVYVA